MAERPSARCLDLTRLVSRVGRGAWTGIDRVEAAYLDACLADPLPLFALIRALPGFVLLDRAGISAMHDKLHGRAAWGAPDLSARITYRSAPRDRQAADGDLRRMGLARCRRGSLHRMVHKHLPTGSVLVNVGHSNLGAEVFAAFHALPGGRVTVLVHDAIPLDFPQLQRRGSVPRFEAKMRTVSQEADLVIHISQDSRAAVERHFRTWGRVPEGVVAHLGFTRPSPTGPPPRTEIDPNRPYFVMIGTIEPRKNHALLMDVWEAMSDELAPEDMPQLVLIGARGWAGKSLYQRFASSPLMGRDIHEMGSLDDNARAHLIAGARALLFPTLAEGFGLPPGEALLLGVGVVASDLPVLREILGNKPVYAPAEDMYSWKKIITELTVKNEAEHSPDKGPRQAPDLPTWQDHFNFILKLT